MSTSLLTARLTVRTFMRQNGYDTTLYNDYQIDNAIADCGEQLARETRLLQIVGTLTLGMGSITLPTMPANFRPDRLMSAYLVGDNIQVFPRNGQFYSPYFSQSAPVAAPGVNRSMLDLAPYQQVLTETYAFRTPVTSGTVTLFTGQPQKIAFKDRTGNGIVFPQPDQNYSAEMIWNNLFATWTLGTQGPWSSTVTYQPGDVVSTGGHNYQALVNSAANLNQTPASSPTYWTDLGAATAVTPPDAVTFPLVDDYLRAILMFGAPSRIQYSEPLGGYAARAREQWDAFVKEMGSRGDLGENYFQRAPANRDWGNYAEDFGGGVTNG